MVGFVYRTIRAYAERIAVHCELKSAWYANVMGLNVDSLLVQYKRIDTISSDVYDYVVYSDLKLFEPMDGKYFDRESLDQLRYALTDSHSLMQIKFLGKLYFVYGLTTTEIRDIPFPNNNVVFELKSKIAAVQNILLSDARTSSSPLVNKPISEGRVGYEREETKMLRASTETPSAIGIAPPSPPTWIE